MKVHKPAKRQWRTDHFDNHSTPNVRDHALNSSPQCLRARFLRLGETEASYFLRSHIFCSTPTQHDAKHPCNYHPLGKSWFGCFTCVEGGREGAEGGREREGEQSEIRDRETHIQVCGMDWQGRDV